MQRPGVDAAAASGLQPLFHCLLSLPIPSLAGLQNGRETRGRASISTRGLRFERGIIERESLEVPLCVVKVIVEISEGYYRKRESGDYSLCSKSHSFD